MVRVGWSCLLQGKLKSLTICNNKSVNFIMVFPCRKSLDFCIDSLSPLPHVTKCRTRCGEAYLTSCSTTQRKSSCRGPSQSLVSELIITQWMYIELMLIFRLYYFYIYIYIYISIDTITTQYRVDIGLIIILLLSQ